MRSFLVAYVCLVNGDSNYGNCEVHSNSTLSYKDLLRLKKDIIKEVKSICGKEITDNDIMILSVSELRYDK